ncbi:hypothetical protein M758_5G121200 [Ceratodon purpureus]|nr:hypothetical protein M758_5G121200 [Ceratodon purpureus]
MGQLSTSLYGSPDGTKEEDGDEESWWETLSSMGSSSSKSSVEEKDKPIIMVLGGPGSGKGTQCSRLVKEFGFKHISLGDILREEVKQGTPIGKECSKIMKEGKLVPVNLTMELMKKAMKNSEGTTGYLLDGFPRATSQARAFQKQVNISLNPLLLQRITFWICFL